MSQDNDVLFQPLKVGALTIPNRIVMAPLTRGRATDRVPNDLMALYYSQRATAGLIISEATAISEQGYGWQGTPGIYTPQQVLGWKRVTDAVHSAGGRIFLQLWHMGRVSHPDYHDGALPVGPSPIAVAGEAHTPFGKKPFVVPHELTGDEVSKIVHDYARATEKARDAGFDGVEIHAANGYLLDQFLRDSSNHRSDKYGGSVQNRVRFLLEVVNAVTAAWAPDRTGVRVSPVMPEQDMHDRDPCALFTHLAAELVQFELAYLHTVEPIRPGRLFAPGEPRVTPRIRQAFRGILFTNGGYEKESAADAIRRGEVDAISFGQKFIANPDLPQRFLNDSPLNEALGAYFYSSGGEGYIDYSPNRNDIANAESISGK